MSNKSIAELQAEIKAMEDELRMLARANAAAARRDAVTMRAILNNAA